MINHSWIVASIRECTAAFVKASCKIHTSVQTDSRFPACWTMEPIVFCHDYAFPIKKCNKVKTERAYIVKQHLASSSRLLCTEQKLLQLLRRWEFMAGSAGHLDYVKIKVISGCALQFIRRPPRSNSVISVVSAQSTPWAEFHTSHEMQDKGSASLGSVLLSVQPGPVSSNTMTRVTQQGPLAMTVCVCVSEKLVS